MIFAIIALFVGFLDFAQALHGWEVHRSAKMNNVENVWPRSIFHEIWNLCHEDNCHGRKVICYKCVDNRDVVLEVNGKYEGGWEGRKNMVEAFLESVGENGGQYVNEKWRAYAKISMKRANGDHVEVTVVTENNPWYPRFDPNSPVMNVGKIRPIDILRELWETCHIDHCIGYRDAGTLKNGKHVIIEALGSYVGGWKSREQMLGTLFDSSPKTGMWYSYNPFDYGWKVKTDWTIISQPEHGYLKFRIFELSEHDIPNYAENLALKQPQELQEVRVRKEKEAREEREKQERWIQSQLAEKKRRKEWLAKHGRKEEDYDKFVDEMIEKRLQQNRERRKWIRGD